MKKTDLFKGIGSLIVGVIGLILANLNLSIDKKVTFQPIAEP